MFPCAHPVLLARGDTPNEVALSWAGDQQANFRFRRSVLVATDLSPLDSTGDGPHDQAVAFWRDGRWWKLHRFCGGEHPLPGFVRGAGHGVQAVRQHQGAPGR
ncbi:hypothetical protein GCM10010452_02200 [Crossiella cryophila]